MPNIDLTKKVPDVYVEESRDFQMMLRVMSCIENSIKYDIDTMQNITNTEKINSDLLSNLSTKLGFFPRKEFYNDTLRGILIGFPFLLKYKGSRKGIELTIICFLHIVGYSAQYKIDIDQNDFKINIGIAHNLSNTDILKEMLRYIIPTGYAIKIYQFIPTDPIKTKLELTINTDVLIAKNNKNSIAVLESEVDSDETKVDRELGTTQIVTADK